jgi:hypothetical protein
LSVLRQAATLVSDVLVGQQEFTRIWLRDFIAFIGDKHANFAAARTTIWGSTLHRERRIK